ncbi:hypothetical protein LCGC14_2946530, partial [marine sediment metagenome]
EFVKPWCEKIQSMIDAAQAEQRRKDTKIARDHIMCDGLRDHDVCAELIADAIAEEDK